ncbi:hypothetical protein E5163_07725 [Marinicauda algicola]|uniref:Uncharacterized protein n=1 Tax=Marinicauda algicola TaxID=2029849 RepID=A0A4S2H174_9PROT|nr:DUF6489 family protein [Marinicauda algicola]TGY89011.1 hypothetical protein E5163_07725 [Marinicauda algicola]
MKVNIEIDCSPEEARAFMGLPDVSAFNQQMVEEMSARMRENIKQMEPETFMRSMMSFGGEWQRQFMDMMQKASGSKS